MEKKNVFRSYDIIAAWYDSNRHQGLMEKAYLEKLIGLVGKGASVLEVGCGTGRPMMEYLLAQGLRVTGVDGSYRMLQRARRHFPHADLLQADMRKLALGRTFDALVAWHSIFHLPMEDQPAMFPVFRKHLNPGGVLMFTSGTEPGETWSGNGGEQLFHASLAASDYCSLLEQHGFRVLMYKENDPQCGGATVWMADVPVSA